MKINALDPDTRARKIASEWHGGMNTALYAFASSGAITGDLLGEIRPLIPTATDRHDSISLRYLERYVSTRDHRGPVEGWGNLNW